MYVQGPSNSLSFCLISICGPDLILISWYILTPANLRILLTSNLNNSPPSHSFSPPHHMCRSPHFITNISEAFLPWVAVSRPDASYIISRGWCCTHYHYHDHHCSATEPFMYICILGISLSTSTLLHFFFFYFFKCTHPIWKMVCEHTHTHTHCLVTQW